MLMLLLYAEELVAVVNLFATQSTAFFFFVPTVNNPTSLNTCGIMKQYTLAHDLYHYQHCVNRQRSQCKQCNIHYRQDLVSRPIPVHFYLYNPFKQPFKNLKWIGLNILARMMKL